jgi:L-cysteine:1D-myo-inositol 2-amino-2-deoxy-alpha-D-glucopyranoside ligase
MAIRLALFAGHYRRDRFWDDGLLTEAQARLAAWKTAAARSGSPADHVVDALRASLADDLDTPAALALLDAWAADDALDGRAVALAVDALLGVTLD